MFGSLCGLCCAVLEVWLKSSTKKSVSSSWSISSGKWNLRKVVKIGVMPFKGWKLCKKQYFILFVKQPLFFFFIFKCCFYACTLFIIKNVNIVFCPLALGRFTVVSYCYGMYPKRWLPLLQRGLFESDGAHVGEIHGTGFSAVLVFLRTTPSILYDTPLDGLIRLWCLVLISGNTFPLLQIRNGPPAAVLSKVEQFRQQFGDGIRQLVQIWESSRCHIILWR